MAGWESRVEEEEGGVLSLQLSVPVGGEEGGKSKFKGEGEKNMRERGRADTGRLLRFEGKGRRRGDPGGSWRKEGGCLQSEKAAERL